jgi:hypothetical protein
VVEPPPPPPPPPPEPPPPPFEPPFPDPDLCPRCGAPHDPYQEYCLECGHRLPPQFAGMRREIWSRESPLWLWAALLALLLVALVAGAVVAIAATREDDKKATSIPVVSTRPGTTDTVGVITQPPTVTINPPTTTTAPTITIPTTPNTTTEANPNTTTQSGIISWPAGKDGYTIVIKSVPTSQGRSQADAAAQRARSEGLPQPGVLNSSDYSSLRPGYWVAFTGVYDTESQAEAALPTARSRGFPLAYVRQVRD